MWTVCTICVCVCVVELYMDGGAGTFRGNIAGFPQVSGTEPEIYLWEWQEWEQICTESRFQSVYQWLFSFDLVYVNVHHAYRT